MTTTGFRTTHANQANAVAGSSAMALLNIDAMEV
jgi:hypothetical protein